MPHPKSLSVFFPCYNDAFTIKHLVEDAIVVLKKITNNYEIIVVDDASTDTSRQILQELLKKHKQLRVILHKKNQGYGGAIRSGIQAAKGEYVFYTDGDGQYDVKELPLLVKKLQGEITFVNGIKMKRHDPLYRIVIGKLYNYFVRLLFSLPIKDSNCDFRLFKTDLIRNTPLKSHSGTICVELVKKAQRNGAVFAQVPVHHYPRRFGKSQFFRPKRIVKTFYELIVLWWTLFLKSQVEDGLKEWSEGYNSLKN